MLHIDERDEVQKKTFTKWINKHLIKVTITGVVYLAHLCDDAAATAAAVIADVWFVRAAVDN